MNRCHICNSACYRPVLTRNESGQMQASGRYQCVKCKFQFSSVAAWRGDEDGQRKVASSETGRMGWSGNQPAVSYSA